MFVSRNTNHLTNPITIGNQILLEEKDLDKKSEVFMASSTK